MAWTEFLLTGHQGDPTAYLPDYQIEVFACVQIALDSSRIGAWHAKYTSSAGDIEICRIGHSVKSPEADCFLSALTGACERRKLGSVNARSIEIHEAFSTRATGVQYAVDDVCSFLPLWQEWSTYIVRLAKANHKELCTNLPILQAATKELLCRHDTAPLKLAFRTLDPNGPSAADAFVAAFANTLRRAHLLGSPTPTLENKRHILLNTLAQHWPGVCP